jgi:predicted oxidoreductase (fatty acid repression mutant protein)
MYNDVYESAKEKAIKYALKDDLKKQAKENIKKVISDILPPLTSSQFGYNLIIVFQDEKLKINQENKTY